jgi:VIT1/CCC1 family predicted Fe2+/Mn2+ transporter
MFGSFLLGGILPVMPYFAVGSGFFPLEIAIGISLSSSFIIGALKARLAKKSWIRGGLEMAGLGTGIALVGYGIGAELANAGIINALVKE